MRYRMLLATMVLGLALSFGHAMAGGPDEGAWAVRGIGTIGFIDRAANIVQLTNGTELYTTDPRMLADLNVGERVLVDFVHDEDARNVINSITPVAPGAAMDAPDASAFGD